MAVLQGLSKSTGLYNSALGQSQLPSTSVNTPFGTVITSGGFYDKNGREPTYTPTVSGWGVASWGGSGSNGLGGLAALNPASITNSSSGATSLTQKDKAAQAYQDAVSTAQKGYQAILGGVESANKHIASADNDLESARKSANGMSAAITNVNNSASALSPFAQSLNQIGQSQLSMYDQLISGDISRGGIAGDYLGAVKAAADAALNIDPDRYVSMAASDVQSAFANAQGQTERELARRGVSMGSGASVSNLRKQLAQSLAVALSAAKTKARQQGIDSQLNALTQRAGMFKDVLNTAQSAGAQASENIAKAAGIFQAQGDLYATAGQLGQSQANSFANIGGVEVNLGQLEMSNNKAVADTLNNISSAQQALGNFYKDTLTQNQFGNKQGTFKFTSYT